VKYAVDTETNEAVAIKILDKEKIQKQNMGNQIKKEISIMKMVKHKYIVGMVEVLASKTKILSFWSWSLAASCSTRSYRWASLAKNRHVFTSNNWWKVLSTVTSWVFATET